MFKGKMVKMLLVFMIILCVFTKATYASDVTLKGFIIQQRFVVPLKDIFNALGADVYWDEETRTVTGIKNNTTVKLTIDSKIVSINGQTGSLDVPAPIIDGRTFVPAKFVSESLGADVSWNSENRVAVIKQEGKIIIICETLVKTGQTLMVNNIADSGTGTLRWALQEAKSGDIIKFNALKFPVQNPATIRLIKALPNITQGYLTLDGSDAGVILDGSKIQNTGESMAGLNINSDGNVIHGLQILNFSSGAGIALGNGSEYNKIGGDTRLGAGPMGQGNLLSKNNIGILIETLDDRETSLNTIKGNFIGTDPTGKLNWGNAVSGVHINFGSKNIIGPSNIIAYNSGDGILISESSSVENTITRNSIFNNKAGGITLASIPLSKKAGIGTLTVPVILDFDLSTGLASGYAFSNSVVEIFSETSNEGKTYEGSALADVNGYFIMKKGSSMKGPSLTATATDTVGYTSPFSAPTAGEEKDHEFQSANNAPQRLIASQSLTRLSDNRIGSMLLLLRKKDPTAEEIQGVPGVTKMWLDHVTDLNMKWQRVSLDVIEYENTSDGSFGLYETYSRQEITHYQNDGIRLLSENGVKITLTIVHWDESLHASRPPDYSNEADIVGYLDYARFLVRNLKDQVDYWEILNEAVHYVPITDYLELIRRVVPVIRQEDPSAKIVVGGSTILLYPEYKAYLLGVLESDIMPLVDGIVIHPMYGPSPQYDSTRDYYYDYPQLIAQIKTLAESNGFEGEYFADEMSWRTEHNRHFAETWEYSEIQAAKYYGRGIVMNQGMDLWTGIGEESVQPIHQMVRNLGSALSGATPIDFDVVIESDFVGPIAYYTFKYANGDRMLAVWTDAAAQDVDPDMSATIVIPGLSTSKVIGIDPLYGVEQDLVFKIEGQNLVIQNFMLKDYPVLIRY